MFKILKTLFSFFISQVDINAVADVSLDLAAELAEKTPSKLDDKFVRNAKKVSKLVRDLEMSFNTKTLGMSNKEKSIVADAINNNNSLVKGIKVSLDKNGPKFSLSL